MASMNPYQQLPHDAPSTLKYFAVLLLNFGCDTSAAMTRGNQEAVRLHVSKAFQACVTARSKRSILVSWMCAYAKPLVRRWSSSSRAISR